MSPALAALAAPARKLAMLNRNWCLGTTVPDGLKKWMSDSADIAVIPDLGAACQNLPYIHTADYEINWAVTSISLSG